MYSFKIYFILVNFVVGIGSNHIRNVKVHMYTCAGDLPGMCELVAGRSQLSRDLTRNVWIQVFTQKEGNLLRKCDAITCVVD